MPDVLRGFTRGLVVLLALITFGSSVRAEAFHIGLRTGAALAFPGGTGLILGAQIEWRELIGEFGVRLDVGFNTGIAAFAVYRPIPDAFGPLYLGLGFGYAFDPVFPAIDTRLLVGYEWLLTPELRVLIEANARFPLDGSPARLEIGVGLNLQLTGDLPQLAPPNAPPNAPPRNPPAPTPPAG